MLPGAAAGLQHVAGRTAEVFFKHSPDRLMIAMERGRVEAAVRLCRLAIPAEFGDRMRHTPLLLALAFAQQAILR